MEEKKPTDEEVIRLLEIFANDNEPDGVNRLAKMALDFINRLQNEVSQWKSKAEHIEEVYDADREHFIKTTTEQKAEIERLTKENARLNKCVMSEEQVRKICADIIQDTIRQTVKDTAKEVLTELKERKEKVKSSYGVSESVGVDVAIRTVKDIAKSKGVEVE